MIDRHRRPIYQFAAGALISLLVSLDVYAQDPLPAPVFPAVDARGVDVATGGFVHSQTDLVIGQPGAGGLVFTRYYQSKPTAFWTHNHNGFIHGSGSDCSVTIGSTTETFTASAGSCAGTFSSQQGGASTLSHNTGNGSYTYTLGDGTTVVFNSNGLYDFISNMNAPYIHARISQITYPTGDQLDYVYEVGSFPDGFGDYITTIRLQHVHSNIGYRLWFGYSTGPNTPSAPPINVTAVNLAVENCQPPSCNNQWPSVSIEYESDLKRIRRVTDVLNNSVEYGYASSTSWALESMTFPGPAGQTSDALTVLYDTQGNVESVDLGFGIWSYQFEDLVTGYRKTQITEPGSTDFVEIWSKIDTGQITTVINELSETVSYTYDTSNRQQRVTFPEQNYVEYVYDARGNIEEVRRGAKPGSNLSEIVTKADYPASCANPKTCNKPTWTEDARGFRTDYLYDAAHGGILEVTPPAPTGATGHYGSGNRPQTRITYDQFQATYLTPTTPPGTTTDTPVWRQKTVSSCSEGSPTSCLGSEFETVSTIAYQSGTTHNVLPVSIETASGDATNTLSSTTSVSYTGYGDIDTVTDPLGNTARYYYDALRRVTGTVGPDPSGSNLPRAIRSVYNDIGQVTTVERGTVPNQSANAFDSFVVLEKRDTIYDQFARPIQSRAWDGSTIESLVEYSYYSSGIPMCTAVRMNPNTFANPPSDACTPRPDGDFGPDRISRVDYDAADRVEFVWSGIATDLEQPTIQYTYTLNGLVHSFFDARNYWTVLEYDGFDRLEYRYYSDPNSTGQANTSDFEQFEYDAFGRLVKAQRRGGNISVAGGSFVYGWDNLGRIESVDAPGQQQDAAFAYDFYGRQTSSSLGPIGQPSHTVTRKYDALSRLDWTTSSLLPGNGLVDYEYDDAGRRTELHYPDGYWIRYDYNEASDLTAIVENGSTVLASFGYDSLGRRNSLTRGSVNTSYLYDAVSRLKTLTQDPTGADHDTTIELEYSPAGQIKTRTRTNDAYDWVTPATSTEGYTPNGLNQYVSITNGNAPNVSPDYDTRGNLESLGPDSYTYDHDNKLIASNGVSLDYDPAGRLHQISDSSLTTRYLYDGHDILAEYDGSGTLLNRYIHGSALDEPLVWYEGATTSIRKHLLADERGSIIGIADNSGAVTSINSYDIYGVPGSGNSGLFQYTGQIWLEDAGLYHYKMRAYDPDNGRFLQTDPIGMAGGMNLYGYVENDPANLVDPFGLDFDDFGWYTHSCDSMCGMLRRATMRAFLDWVIRAEPYLVPNAETGTSNLPCSPERCVVRRVLPETARPTGVRSGAEIHTEARVRYGPVPTFFIPTPSPLHGARLSPLGIAAEMVVALRTRDLYRMRYTDRYDIVKANVQYSAQALEYVEHRRNGAVVSVDKAQCCIRVTFSKLETISETLGFEDRQGVRVPIGQVPFENR